jgi:hypothetical protein
MGNGNGSLRSNQHVDVVMNRVYLEILAEITPMPDLIRYMQQCFRFNFNLEDEEYGNAIS